MGRNGVQGQGRGAGGPGGGGSKGRRAVGNYLPATPRSLSPVPRQETKVPDARDRRPDREPWGPGLCAQASLPRSSPPKWSLSRASAIRFPL